MNFQKRDSTEESIVALPQLAKPKENQEEDDISDRLSDILAAKYSRILSSSSATVGGDAKG